MPGNQHVFALALVTFSCFMFQLVDSFSFSVPLGNSQAGRWLGHYSAHRAVKTSNIRMGWFDAIGKALQESMANDESLGEKTNPGFRVPCNYEGLVFFSVSESIV